MQVPFAKTILRVMEKARTGGVWAPSSAPVQVGSGIQAQGWQAQAWRIWRCLGEVHYPTTHLARQLGRLAWHVSIDGRELPADAAAELLDGVTNGLGPRDASTAVGLNLQVAGEAWYLEHADGTFGVYSVTTPKLDEMAEASRVADRVALRVYFPDPVEPQLADSAMRTAIGPAEELLTLSSLSRAQSRSRIAQAGITLVNGSIKYGDADPFGKDFQAASEAAIKDVEHPAAMVGIKVTVPDEYWDRAVAHVTFDRPYDDKIPAKIEAATKRLALTLDIEPTLLLGTESATHWTAWLSALETYTSHLEPIAFPVGELYAQVAERLLLRDLGLTVDVRVWPNAKELLAKRSTVRDALDAAKLGAVGLRYVRDAIGAVDEDAPTDEELEILRLVPRETGRDVAADETVGEAQPSGPDPVSAALEPPRHDAIAAAASVAVAAARRKVGTKVRSRLRGDDAAELIDGVANCDVVATLGHAGEVECGPVVWAALEEFQGWWDAHQPTSGRDAAVRLGTWVVSTLTVKASDLSDGDLVAELLREGDNNAA